MPTIDVRVMLRSPRARHPVDQALDACVLHEGSEGAASVLLIGDLPAGS